MTSNTTLDPARESFENAKAFFVVSMEAKCSFSGIVGGSCTYERRDRAKNTEVIPLLHCNREIAGHKSKWEIEDVETEVELILARKSIFTFPENIA